MTRSRQTKVPDAGLVPRPRNFSYLPGVFKPHAGATISADPAFASELAWAISALEVAFTARFEQVAPDTGLVHVARTDGLGTEGYRLLVQSTGVRAEASEPAGAFYALQTLRSLALIHGDRAPSCRIEDEPRFPWRGYMLDTV
ncbi:MAG: hypothetical protein JXM71_08885, partial [Spirochaetales bacterium]|nr:hypothetical protein [Spirochaetales bacterium]